MPVADPKNTSTVGALIAGALRLLGALRPGEQPTPQEYADALEALNDMVESWSADGLMVFGNDHLQLALVPGQASYQLGPGGDWDAPRPMVIEAATLRTTNTSTPIDYPIGIVDDETWREILSKQATSQYPIALRSHGDYPLDTIEVWPVPTVAHLVLLDTQKQLGRFAATTDTLNVQPPLRRALRYGLAIELAPEYTLQPTQTIVQTYTNAKNAVKGLNVQPQTMRADPAVLSPSSGRSFFNIRTGR